MLVVGPLSSLLGGAGLGASYSQRPRLADLESVAASERPEGFSRTTVRHQRKHVELPQDGFQVKKPMPTPVPAGER